MDFSKGYPVVKVLQGQQALFEILLTPEQLIETKIIKGQLFPLSGKSYGAFDGGQALLLGKEAVLYISPEGLLWSNQPLRASYHFDPQKQLVSYKIFEHRFGEELAQISFKVKAL